ncbi:MAG TPA: hypothetical protein VEB64_11655, partial [Azospirillaceae bacterium]|nr:hypothetical protein [Azospirillaceae bacterium]
GRGRPSNWGFPGLARTRAAIGWALAGGALDGWRVVAASTALAFVLSLAFLRLWTPEFTATMVVGPTARNGIAAMGLRVPTPGQESASAVVEYGAGDEGLSDFARFLQLLTSTAVAERLMTGGDVPQRLFPGRWEPATGQWRAPGGLSGLARFLFLALVGREDWSEPDPERLAQALRRAVVVEAVGTTAMRRISFRHADRAFAMDLLSRLHAAADAQLRQEAARRSKAQIDYIKERIGNVGVAEHRRALATVLGDLERVLMMIEVGLPFAADPIEAATAGRQPDWPNPALVLPAGLAAGAGLGLLAFSLRASSRRQSEEMT